jgi:hypothetical protein
VGRKTKWTPFWPLPIPFMGTVAYLQCPRKVSSLYCVRVELTIASVAMNGCVQPRLILLLVIKEGSLWNAQYLLVSLITNCLLKHGNQWKALPILVEPTNEIYTELLPLIKCLIPILLLDLCYLCPKNAFTALQVAAFIHAQAFAVIESAPYLEVLQFPPTTA